MYSQNYQEYCSRVRQIVELSQADDGEDEDGDCDGEEEEDDEASQALAAQSVHSSAQAAQEEERKGDDEDENEGTMLWKTIDDMPVLIEHDCEFR